jgi:hypothetical protein
MKCAPFALATKSGYFPGHFVIHDIGTPPGITFFAAANRSALFGVRAKKRSSSLACNLFKSKKIANPVITLTCPSSDYSIPASVNLNSHVSQ